MIDNRFLRMEIFSSVLSIVKNVSETQREFRILKDKLSFHIKKAETALLKYKHEQHVHSFILINLDGRLRDANERLAALENILCSDRNDRQGISFTDKLKLSLPFNNERDKISQAIEDLRQATQELLNNQLTSDEFPKRKIESPLPEPNLDEEIDELYEMGPTIQQNNALDFAMEFTKNHTLELRIEALGNPQILALLTPENKTGLIEKSCQRASKEEQIEMFQLGRMNFKKEYKSLKPLFPDIDKISKLAHFRILWKRHLPETALPGVPNSIDPSQKKVEPKVESLSQKKEEGEQFFSVPQGLPQEICNGRVMLQKEKRCLYRRGGAKWVKVQEERMQLVNGQEVAVSLNKDSQADLFFKISYKFK